MKVLHAARQDLEVLSRLAHARAPARRARTDLRHADRRGTARLIRRRSATASLVAERLGHTLAKGHARTDWTRRPLSAGAAAVRRRRRALSRAAVSRSARRAAARGTARLAVRGDSRARADPSLYRTEPEDAWRRLKGLDRLQPQQRATAKLLAQWREDTAIKHDKPRGWILADEALREIAERLPATTARSRSDPQPAGRASCASAARSCWR